MKAHPAFFRDAQTRRLLDLAAAAAAVPVCIHTRDTLKLMGWGGCAACSWVNDLPGGKQACHDCRAGAAATARRQHVPVTFVCHMGFTCVIASALRDSDFTVVLGPYIPAEAREEVAYAVEKGLSALDHGVAPPGPLPFSLDDVRTIPQGAIRAAAEWLLDGLRARFVEYEQEQEETGPEEQGAKEPDAPVHPASREASGAAVEVSIVALSLVCGRTGESRAFLSDLYEEAASERGGQPRSRVMRAVSELLEAVQRMTGNIDDAWTAYSLFIEEALPLNTKEELLKRAGKVLRRAARACEGHFADKCAYMPRVMDELHRHYASGNLLTRTAGTAGVAPSSITRKMEKLTGATFSEVLGRIRIAHARRLLRHTGMSATGIALLVGIQDQSNFSKLFLRYCGCSPGAYRAKYHG